MSIQKIGYSEFKSKSQARKNTTFTSTFEHDKEKCNASRLMLGATALAAVGLASICMIKHGKIKVKPVDKLPIMDLPEGKLPDVIKPPVSNKDMVMTPKAKEIYDKFNRGEKDFIDPCYGERLYDSITAPEVELQLLNNDLRHREMMSEKGQKIKAEIEKLLTPTKTPDAHLGDRIIADIDSKAMKPEIRTKMQEFYSEMEKEAFAEAQVSAQKQAKREAMLKLKKENPAEYKRLQTERRKQIKAQKAAAKAKAYDASRKSCIIDGTIVEKAIDGEEKITKRYAVNIKDGMSKSEALSFAKYKGIDPNDLLEKGNLISTKRCKGNNVLETFYSDGAKTATKFIAPNRDVTYKIFVKNEKGQTELLRRLSKNGDKIKTVDRLGNGNTMITVEDRYTKEITIRNKKGEIIHVEKSYKSSPKPPSDELKALVMFKAEPYWYTKYLELCKLYHIEPKKCSKLAFDQFQLLYIKNGVYKANYNLDSYIKLISESNRSSSNCVEPLLCGNYV